MYNINDMFVSMYILFIFPYQYSFCKYMYLLCFLVYYKYTQKS